MIVIKIYISADMEGATGVTGAADVSDDKPAYERFRKLLTKDVNAAVEGAFEGGAKNVVVNEAHANKRNILLEELHEEAEMISGPTRFLCMMEGINESFDGVFLIGYHARGGTQAAVLNHTISGSQIYNIRLNGNLIGELGLSVLMAGQFGVPVILVSGDDKVCAEAQEFIPFVETAQVKVGIDRYVAKCLTPTKTSHMIKEAAIRALKNIKNYKPVKIEGSIKMEIDFMNTSQAASAELLPGTKREGSRTISYVSNNYQDAYKFILNSMFLASRTSRG